MLRRLGPEVGDVHVAVGVALDGTMRMPHMAADAGLVPCAETGMRQTSRSPSPSAAW